MQHAHGDSEFKPEWCVHLVNLSGYSQLALNIVPVPSKPLHRAPDPPAARVMTRRISLGAAAPPIPINTRNTQGFIQSQPNK